MTTGPTLGPKEGLSFSQKYTGKNNQTFNSQKLQLTLHAISDSVDFKLYKM